MITQLAVDANAGSRRQYGFGVRLSGTTIDRARELVTAALAAEGFEVTSATEIGKMIGAPRYLILSAFNAELARRALDIEPYAGLVLPCNVTLWREANEAVVTIASPDAMLNLAGDARLRPVVVEAEQRLRSALHRVLA